MNLLKAAADTVGQMVDAIGDGILGISQGQIQIQMDKFNYVGGDTVTGNVQFQCFQPFQAKGVIVKFKGYQSATFERWRELPLREGETERRRELERISETSEFFKDVLVVFGVQGMVQPGNYTFPFQYTLPSNLPGTYFEEGGCWGEGDFYRAAIVYQVTAKVDVRFKHDVKHKVRLVVNEKFDKSLAPSYSENSKKFMFTAGRLGAKVWLDHNVYFPGNTVVAKLEANNTSTKKTTKLEVNVHKHLRLTARGQSWDKRSCVYHREYPGFDPCYYGVRFLPFQIPMDLLPSTKSGRHVRCTYTFEVVCDIPGAIDLHVKLDTTVLAPQYLYSSGAPALPPLATIPGDASFRPPWQPDAASKTCTGCGKGFTLINRRHHCRHCAKLFCKKCTPHTLKIPALGYTEDAVRVCNGCQPDAASGGKLYQEAPTFAAGEVQEVAWTPPANMQMAIGDSGAGANSSTTTTTMVTSQPQMTMQQQQPQMSMQQQQPVVAQPQMSMQAGGGGGGGNMQVSVTGSGDPALAAAAAADMAAVTGQMMGATMGATMAMAGAMEGAALSMENSMNAPVPGGGGMMAAGTMGDPSMNMNASYTVTTTSSSSSSGGPTVTSSQTSTVHSNSGGMDMGMGMGMGMGAASSGGMPGMMGGAPSGGDMGLGFGIGSAGGMAMDDGSFAALKEQLKSEAFSASKIAVLETAAGSNMFTSQQCHDIIKQCFDFGADQQKAGVILYPRVVDKQNFHIALGAFTFDSDMKALKEKLGI